MPGSGVACHERQTRLINQAEVRLIQPQEEWEAADS